jgi:transposase
MHYSHYIGVDISKNTLDAAIYAAEMRRSDTKHLPNDKTGLKELVAWAKAAGAKPNDMLICAEHTGVYSNELQLFCEKKGIALCLESPLQIKRSMGLVRGKDDQIDAIRIAQYAYDHRINSNCSTVPPAISSLLPICLGKDACMCAKRPL